MGQKRGRGHWDSNSGQAFGNPVCYHSTSGLDSAYQLTKKIDLRATCSRKECGYERAFRTALYHISNRSTPQPRTAKLGRQWCKALHEIQKMALIKFAFYLSLLGRQQEPRRRRVRPGESSRKIDKEADPLSIQSIQT